MPERGALWVQRPADARCWNTKQRSNPGAGRERGADRTGTFQPFPLQQDLKKLPQGFADERPGLVARYHRARRGAAPVEAIVDAAADEHADMAMVDAHRVEDSQVNRIVAVEVKVKKQRFRLERPARPEAPLDASARGPADGKFRSFGKQAGEVVLHPHKMVTECKAARGVDQHRTPGAANPETSSAKRIKSRPARDEENAETVVDVASDIRPGIVAFDTEYPVAKLPIEADRAASWNAPWSQLGSPRPAKRTAA